MDEADKPARPKRRRRIILIVVIVVIALIIIALVAVFVAARFFTAAESEVRSDWSVETGELLVSEDGLGVNVYDATATSDDLTVVQLTPAEVDQEDFTYYDVDVQDRLKSAIGQLKDENDETWTATNPLAVLNPFGTGSNGLYLYFKTDMRTQVSYTVHVDDDSIKDYTAVAKNTWLDDSEESDEDNAYTTEHEFQLIGLVPGETNEVTMSTTGSWGNTRQEVTFTIDMPAPQSDYDTRLESVEGTSEAELSDGFYTLMRTNGYLGYGFFVDNDGIMRYEMVLEGYGLDRILDYEGDMVTTVSSKKIARIDGLGRVKQVYDLGEYDMHHDLNYTDDKDTVVVLAEREGAVEEEDLVLEVNLATGEINEVVDFTSLMSDYVDNYTHVISVTDPFFWQAGELDWIHLNSIQWLPGEDSIIVSSRETSTIIKVENFHEDPEIAYLIGDDSFWEGTPYEGLCFEQVGDFKLQYGQHNVVYDGAYGDDGADVTQGIFENEKNSDADADGTDTESDTKATTRYYLLLYDNNYWALSTRSDYEPDLGGQVSEEVYDDPNASSHMYRYLVDEEAKTFELVDSFDVPYSSIVSNVSHAPDTTNYVVNSGVANVFGEYDHDGNLIKQFAYNCTLQGYRVFKDNFEGFWFAPAEE